MKGNILLVDDAADIRELLGAVLRENYDVTEADSGASLKQCFSKAQPDVILLDIKLPDADGLELLPQIKKQWPETEVIVLTGNATFDAAVEATKRGAYHFVTKPFDTQALRVTLDRALEHKQQNEESSNLRRALSTMSGGTAPVLPSSSMQNVVPTVERVAPSDVSLLLTRESGTAKEPICRPLPAANREAADAINDGKLREDLFYRISAISVYLPPLRERREDIMPLANSFLKRFSAQANRVITGFSPHAVERLTGFDWPGNIRQLQNEVQRAVLLSEGDQVDAADLSITGMKPSGEGAGDTNFSLLEGVDG